MTATVTRFDGAGITLTNAGITWDSDIVIKSLGGLKWTRQMLDDTPLSATTQESMVIATLKKYESLEIEYFADPNKPAPSDGALGTWVITFPPKIGETNGATITFTGAIIMDDTGDMKQGDRRISKATLMPDGKTGPTFAAGS